MQTSLDFPKRSKGSESHLLSLLALFDGDFLIDWVVELSNKETWEILALLKEEVQKGVLIEERPGIYSFESSEKRRKLLRQLNPEERVQAHRQIANLLLRRLPDKDTKAQILAPHLLQISADTETCRWLLRAGDFNLRVFRNEDALKCYSKVLNDLSGLHGEEIDCIFVEAAIKYSKISIGREDTERILDFLYDAIERARHWNNNISASLLEMHIAKNKWLLSKYRSALKHFEHGWKIAKELNNPKLLRSAKTFSNFFLYWQGRFREVVESYEKSVPDVEKYPKGNYPLIAASLVGYCYCLLGHCTQGLGMLNSVHKFCIDMDNQHAAARASLNIGKVMFDMGEINEAIQSLEIATEEAIRGPNNFVLISGKELFAYAHYLKGDSEKSIAYLNEFLMLSEQVKISVQPYPYLLELLYSMEEGKLPHVSGLSFEKILRQMIRNQNIFMKGVAYRFKALLQKREGLPSKKIMQSLNASVKLLEESGHQIQLALSLIELVRQDLSIGNTKSAEKIAQRAFQILSSFNEHLFPEDFRSLIRIQHHDDSLLKEILKLGQEVVTIRNDKELVQKIISTVNRITGAERGAIFLMEDNTDGSQFKLRASKNLTLEEISHPSFESSVKMIEEVASAGKGRIMEMNSGSEAGFRSHEIVHSKICVPMILRDNVMGVLYHDNCFLRSAFKESDLELLAYFASLAGFALDKARAWEEVQRLNKKLHEEKMYFEEEHLQTLHFDDIIGESDSIKNVLVQVNQVANTDSTVLILGETGVGKELVARAIHRLSPRGDRPFIRVNCSSFPEGVIASELFGHEKGAFTGAISRRIGRFELADSGTLFLDEVGDLSLDVQVRLLQVLQHKEFERVGGSKTIHSDFRLLAATNRDLNHLVEREKFRLDLFYRLNVFPIYIPPLKDRKKDIPILAYYFLKIYTTKMRKSLRVVPDEEMDKLVQYHWPGNVRELENIIERGTILASGNKFNVPELSVAPGTSDNFSIKHTLEENERHHVLWALNKTGWKVRGVGGAAELLDIHPSTLTYRMKKLGINRPKGIPKKRASSFPIKTWIDEGSWGQKPFSSLQ